MITPITVIAALQLFSRAVHAQPRTFDADQAVALDGGAAGNRLGVPLVRNTAAGDASGEDDDDVELERQDLISVGKFIRTCDCTIAETVKSDDIRGISDQFCSDGNTASSAKLTNMVWGFGQFLDHDLALTIEDEDGPSIEVGTEQDTMEVHRAVTEIDRGCKNTLNVHTPHVDAGPIYGSDESYVQSMLRRPGTCFLRTSRGNLLPVTTNADDEGSFFIIAGDVRVSEHAFLAAQHTVWVREHNRICESLNADSASDGMSEDAKFDMVRDVIIAKFQQVVLTEFLPALGITQQDLESAQPLVTGPEISVEFSIAYRLGHDLIGNNVGGMSVASAFNSEEFFLRTSGTPDAPTVEYKINAEVQLSSIMWQLALTPANEIDGKLSDALRNNLFGPAEGEDLAGRNIARGRDLGIPTYGGLAECFGLTPDSTVESETPDAWVGLMREPKAGGVLPPTLRAIILEQFHRLFFGTGGLYWRDSIGKLGPFVSEVEGSTYGEIISANIGMPVSGNVFKM